MTPADVFVVGALAVFYALALWVWASSADELEA